MSYGSQTSARMDTNSRDAEDGLLGGHPVLAIEAGEVDGAGERVQGAFAAHVEIHIEVAHGELAQSAVDGFAIAASAVVGFGHRAPMAVHAIEGEDVVGVVVGLEIEQ